MIAIDTNLLVYAHRAATPEHRLARAAIERAAGRRGGFAITVPSVAEFMSIVTHPLASGRASSPAEAAAFLRALEEGGMRTLGPGPAFAARFLQTAVDLAVGGPRVFDLQIALCALDGGATELWTHDARFVRVPGLIIHDPLA
ncbi:MAG: PIN domain-containing protein [Planctomycetia bacterium]|nr:PIN domain-containing protein [Planctomycetia bacterium]